MDDMPVLIKALLGLLVGGLIGLGCAVLVIFHGTWRLRKKK